MQATATNLSLTLLHSFWQSALLVLVYISLHSVTKVSPQGKRNMLFSIITLQLLISVCTFILLSIDPVSVSFEHLTAFQFINDSAHWLQPWSSFICTVYLIFIGFKAINHLYHWNKLKNYNRLNLIKPNVDLRLFTDMKSYQIGVKKVQLWLSDNIQSPFTYGYFKPVILLPVALVNRLSIEETESLIIHELTHIRNNDYLLNILLIICETLFFFNPFTRYIINTIKLEREKNCDLQVLQFQYSPVLYAEALLKTAQFKSDTNEFRIAAVSKKNQLLQRILFFTDEKNNQKMKKAFNPLTYAVVLLIAFTSLFIFAEDKKINDHLMAQNNFINPSYQYDITDGIKPTVVNNIFKAGKAESEIQPTVAAVIVPATEPEVVQFPDVELSEGSDFVMHASAKMQGENVRDVIIKDEDPTTGKVTTRIYKSSFENGNWTAEPVMEITESIDVDSCAEVSEPVIVPFNPEQ